MSSAPLSFEPGFMFNPQLPPTAPSLVSMPLSGHELNIRNEFIWRVRALNFVSNCALVLLTALLADGIIPAAQLADIGVPVMDDAIKHYIWPILGISLTMWSLHQLRKETFELPALNKGVGLLFPPIALALALSFLSAQILPTTSMMLAALALYLTSRIYRQLKSTYPSRYWKDSILLHTPFAFLLSYLLNDLIFRLWMLSLRFHPTSTPQRSVLPLRTLAPDFYLTLAVTTAVQITLSWHFHDPILPLMAAMMTYRMSSQYGTVPPGPPAPPGQGQGGSDAPDPTMDIGSGALPMATAALITFTVVVAVPAVCMRKRRSGETRSAAAQAGGATRRAGGVGDSAVVSVNSDATPAYAEFDPHTPTVTPPAPTASIHASSSSPTSAYAVVNAGPSTVASTSALTSPRASLSHTIVTLPSEPPSPSRSSPNSHAADLSDPTERPPSTTRSRSTSDAPSLASVESVEDAAAERALVGGQQRHDRD